MKKLLLIIIATALCSLFALGQTSLEQIKSNYEAEAIYHTSARSYIKDGKKHRIGCFGKKMLPEFEISSEGKITYQKYISQRKTGLVLGIGAFAGLIGYSLLFDYDNLDNPDNNLAMASYGAGLAFAGAGIYNSIKLERNLEKSIWLRNRDIFQEEEVRKRYEVETIYMFGSSRYIKGGEKNTVGFLGRKMKPEFEISPEGMAVFQQYRSQEKTALILMGAGLAALIGSFFIVDFDDVSNPNNFLAGATYGAGLAITGFSLNYVIKSQRNFKKAIWLRNRDVLSRK
ncbi:MAG: hypothetical protein H0X62_02500 [Bacteroidetes bacterium]|nr:hypothetical protein [Bacteroidota bacterium]